MARALKAGEHVVGIDVGGTKMMAVVFDHEWQVVARCRKKAKPSGQSQTLEGRIEGTICGAMKEAGIDGVAAIGAAIPGPVEPDTGIIIDTPNLKWRDFPLAKVLSESFGVPAVLENDVNAGTYGEWCAGEVSDCRDVLGVFPGTGIGGGLILGGRLHHGFSKAAGEVGHMTYEVDGPFCGCGKRGCLEAVASRLSIASSVAALAARGDAPHIAEKYGTDIAKIKSGALARAIAAGDTMVEDVVRKAAFAVGVGIASLINVISPEAVVLGGGLVEAMEDLYVDEVERAVSTHAMPTLRKGVKIVAARLGDDAVAMGAARLALERGLE